MKTLLKLLQRGPKAKRHDKMLCMYLAHLNGPRRIMPSAPSQVVSAN
ncbi:hypothetical protein ACXR0O_28405 [Verrucomicrobiota bacterium sgz303538]